MFFPQNKRQISWLQINDKIIYLLSYYDMVEILEMWICHISNQDHLIYLKCSVCEFTENNSYTEM